MMLDVNNEMHMAALKLAAEAECDPRTALRALREGPDKVKGLVGARLARAMEALGLAKGAT
jgi:hypothetical protein